MHNSVMDFNEDLNKNKQINNKKNKKWSISR